MLRLMIIYEEKCTVIVKLELLLLFQYHLNAEKMNMAMLRNVQGLAAPMKLAMEMKFASKVIQYKVFVIHF